MPEDKFNAEKILLKEKVEDMWEERDQAHQGPAYDMSKAKVHIMNDATMLPYYELDHITPIHAWYVCIDRGISLHWSHISFILHTYIYDTDACMPG